MKFTKCFLNRNAIAIKFPHSEGRSQTNKSAAPAPTSDRLCLIFFTLPALDLLSHPSASTCGYISLIFS
ncbi:hypothetical protein NDI37_05580 [Funiculus sociatus GB2-A5]|uniref:Uncharacterized protein n=1 Tax=Funiculus sociatus GB2-A5 TaxID=2933946 RepID=A0ABV0JKG9_9CYAN|nr:MULTISPECIES: hypothetical protein [unclassified Trichocoleus]MBD1905189.1 hypothetical protein [Trichocoleus sp. FACHB-832]MBD2061018.1 hypothetical protein [Trichocoleus sp. FACHB-6]